MALEFITNLGTASAEQVAAAEAAAAEALALVESAVEITSVDGGAP